MNLFRNILCAMALVLSAMAGHHAGPPHHDHDHGAATRWCALPAHDCGCHACEQVPCRESLRQPQRQDVLPVVPGARPPARPLFRIPDPSLPSRSVPPAPSCTLASLASIQLLI